MNKKKLISLILITSLMLGGCTTKKQIEEYNSKLDTINELIEDKNLDEAQKSLDELINKDIKDKGINARILETKKALEDEKAKLDEQIQDALNKLKDVNELIKEEKIEEAGNVLKNIDGMNLSSDEIKRGVDECKKNLNLKMDEIKKREDDKKAKQNELAKQKKIADDKAKAKKLEEERAKKALEEKAKKEKIAKEKQRKESTEVKSPEEAKALILKNDGEYIKNTLKVGPEGVKYACLEEWSIHNNKFLKKEGMAYQFYIESDGEGYSISDYAVSKDNGEVYRITAAQDGCIRRVKDNKVLECITVTE